MGATSWTYKYNTGYSYRAIFRDFLAALINNLAPYSVSDDQRHLKQPRARSPSSQGFLGMQGFVQAAIPFLVILGSCILSVGLISLSFLCVTAPEFSAEMYGLPVQAAGGWLAAVGLRDFGLGASTLALFLFDRPALRVYVPSLLVVPLGDAAITLWWGGTTIGAATHCLGAVAILLLAIFAWLDPALNRTRTDKAD